MNNFQLRNPLSNQFSSQQITNFDIFSERKMNCKNCNKKTNCCCKKCTLEKLKIYSRRENITQRYEEKERLQAEILAFIDPTVSF